jgi:hypothetical protein
LRLIPGASLLEALRADYEKMIANGMFEGDPPTFDSTISRLEKLEKQINTL